MQMAARQGRRGSWGRVGKFGRVSRSPLEQPQRLPKSRVRARSSTSGSQSIRTCWRRLVLRVYWDGEATPSIETPLGDFFCNGWCERCNISSLPIAVNPAGGFNSYWEMPFRKSARITLENLVR